MEALIKCGKTRDFVAEHDDMTIWKFDLSTSKTSTITAPEEAKFLIVQEHRNNICLWALVDPVKPMRQYVFHCYCTGEIIDGKIYSRLIYISTVQTSDNLIYHYFLENN